MTTKRSATAFRAAIQLLAIIIVAGCAEAPPPPPPPLPPEPQYYSIPVNDQLEGDWSASYPNGPIRVNIQADPQLGDHNYVARLVDKNYGTIHPGEVSFTGTPNASIATLVNGDQKCSIDGRMGLRHAPISITVQDHDHFTATLVHAGACPGFPVHFTRITEP
jgi:hypothetical protein